jgi:hypothetical protein
MFQTFVFKMVTGFLPSRQRSLFSALNRIGEAVGMLGGAGVPTREIKRL